MVCFYIVRLRANGVVSMGEFFPSFPVQYPKIPLDVVEYDYQVITVKTLKYGIQNVATDPHETQWKFTLTDTNLYLSVPIHPSCDFEISFFGTLQTLPIAMSVIFLSKQNDFKLTALRQPINGIEASQQVKLYTGLNVPEKLNFQAEFASFSGIQKIDGDGTWFSLKFFHGTTDRIAIVRNLNESELWQGFAVFSNSSQISLPDFYPVDIKLVPYFGTATTEDIAYIELSTDDRVLNCDFPEGIFSDILPPHFVPSYVERLSIEAVFGKSLAVFSIENNESQLKLYPHNNAATFSEVFDLIAPEVDFEDQQFFFDVRMVQNIGVNIITSTLNPDQDGLYTLCIDLIDDNELSFFYGRMIISGADIKFCLRKMPQQESVDLITHLDVSANGDFTIEEDKFQASMEKKNGEYTISASADKLNMSQAIRHFRARVLPRKLSQALKDSPFLGFVMNKPILVHHISSTDQQFLQITGHPILQNYTGVSMDAIVVHNKTNQLAMEVSIGSVSLDRLLHDVTQLPFVEGTPMLDQEVQAAVSISPVTIEDPYYYYSFCSNHQIDESVTIEANFSITGTCFFCTVAQSLLSPEKQFKVKGVMDDAKSFTLSASNLKESIDLSNNYIMRNAGFSIELAREYSTVGVIGTLPIERKLDQRHILNITLTVAIQPAADGGLKAHLTMPDCWKHSFALSWLAICNIAESIDITANTSVALPQMLELGADIRLGNDKKGCTVPIVAKGQVVISAMPYQNVSYSAQIPTRKSFGSLIKVLCWNTNLTKPLKDSFFPEGFTVSYSTNPQQTPDSEGYEITEEHQLTGLLEIVGLLGLADVTVLYNVTHGYVRVYEELPLVSTNKGLIVMFRSGADQTNGPVLRATVDQYSVGPVTITGSVVVLGNTVDAATLTINENMYSFDHMKIKLVNLYPASVDITALYSSYLPEATFRVKGKIDSDLQNVIYKEMTEVFYTVVTEVERKVRDAEKILAIRQRMHDHSKAAIKDDKMRVKEAHGEYSALENAATDANNKVQATFSKCPSWAGRGCNAMKLMSQKHLEVSKLSKEQALHSLDLVRESFNKTHKSFINSENSVRNAEEFLSHTKEKNKLALQLKRVVDDNQAMNSDGTLTIQKLIRIDDLEFQSKLSDIDSGTFVAQSDITFFPNKVEVTKRLRLLVNLKNLTPVCKELANHMGENFGNFF